MTSHKLDSCLRDMREQAEILYDTITVHRSEWARWQKEITDEVDKLDGYEPSNRTINEELVVVAEHIWEMT